MRTMWRISTVLILTVACCGCDARIDRFEPNEVFALTIERSRSTPSEAALADAAEVVDRLFGDPNEPAWPVELLGQSSTEGLVDVDRLSRAAGAVFSDKEGTNHGLYRKHCVNCHGLSGSGAGPASLFQDPYPRDFRHGVFKWKSTERASKPTRDDLRQLLQRGVPDTAMPSFSLVDEEDIESLVDYVIYLSVRGEVERRLVVAAVDELEYSDDAPDEDSWRLVNESPDSDGAEVVRQVLQRVTNSWLEADSQVVVPPPADRPETVDADQSPKAQAITSQAIERGKAIFHGQIANCVGCHGPSGNGGVVTLDYDDWSKEYSTRIGVTPTDREAMRPLREAGALPPRQSKPRKFSEGVIRGGDDGETLYRRITQGIAGTPMPAVPISTDPSATALTPGEVWDLVRYVQSLGKQP